ncbi:MAG: tetratricopeptide repeat protein [Acidimicrobiia bacterium]|nr:tetratricopeptide repeat protein [Acidimicrobiia bacterium]
MPVSVRGSRCAFLAIALWTAACSRSIDEVIASGDAYAAEGRHREAVLEFRTAAQQDPTRGHAFLKLGDALMELGDLQNAALVYFRASQLLPNDMDAQMKAGNMLLAGKMYTEAQICARRVLTVNPRSIPAQVLNANALAGMKRLDAAMLAIQQAIALDPTRASTYSDMGALQLSLSPEESEANFRRAIELDPESGNPRVTLASFYWAQGRVTDTEAELKRALDVDPENVAVHRALATLYLSTGRAPLAETHLRQFVEATPTTPVRLMLADYYLSLGRTGDARTILAALEQAPDGFGEARSRLATLEYDAGRTDAAHALIDDTITTDPAHARAILTKAHFLLREGDTEGAEERAEAALRADPQSIVARYLLASIHVGRGDTPEAVQLYTDIIRINPGSVAAKLELARIRLAMGDSEGAREFSEEVTRDAPGSLQAQVFAFRAAIAQGDLPRADRLAEALLRVAGTRADVLWLAGSLRLLHKDLGGARTFFERSLEAQPDVVEPLDGLIAIELASNNATRALELIDGALGRQPTHPALLLLAARVYTTTGDRPRASELLRRAIEADPQNAAPYEQLARNYAADGQLDRAAAEFSALAKKTPRAVGPPTMMGTILQAQGKPFEALRWYEEALAIDDRALVAANNLAWLYAELGGDLDAALRLATLAVELTPGQIEVQDTLGWVYYKRGDFGQALPILRRCVERDPDNPVYRYHLGLTYAGLDNLELAKQSLSAALKMSSDFPGATNARVVLSNLD